MPCARRQIEREFKRIAPRLRIAAVYGGVDYNKQLRQIRDGLDIVVGTPGTFCLALGAVWMQRGIHAMGGTSYY